MRGKMPPESGKHASANWFSEKWSPLGLTPSARKHRDLALTSGNPDGADFRVPEEMDRQLVPLGQSNHWEEARQLP